MRELSPQATEGVKFIKVKGRSRCGGIFFTTSSAAPRHLPKLGKAHRTVSSVDHGEESKTILFFDFVVRLKLIPDFTSVDGTSDNGSLPVSGKVVPQAPDEEV